MSLHSRRIVPLADSAAKILELLRPMGMWSVSLHRWRKLSYRRKSLSSVSPDPPSKNASNPNACRRSINRTPHPHTNHPDQRIRLRLVNQSNSRQIAFLQNVVRINSRTRLSSIDLLPQIDQQLFSQVPLGRSRESTATEEEYA